MYYEGKQLGTHYFECEAQCIEHIGRITYNHTEGDPSEYDYVYIELMLNHYLNLFKRMVIAFKYIFKLGYSNSLHFDSLIIHKRDIPKIIEVLTKLKKD